MILAKGYCNYFSKYMTSYIHNYEELVLQKPYKAKEI